MSDSNGMVLMTGKRWEQTKLPGSEKYYIQVRYMKCTPRDEFELADGLGSGKGADPEQAVRARQLLRRHSVVDFLLPAGNGDNIRATKDDPDAMMEQLEECPGPLSLWILEHCYRINDYVVRAELTRMEREGVVIAAEKRDELIAEVRAATERVLGNSAASPEPTGEATTQTTGSSESDTPES